MEKKKNIFKDLFLWIWMFNFIVLLLIVKNQIPINIEYIYVLLAFLIGFYMRGSL